MQIGSTTIYQAHPLGKSGFLEKLLLVLVGAAATAFFTAIMPGWLGLQAKIPDHGTNADHGPQGGSQHHSQEITAGEYRLGVSVSDHP